MFIEKVKGSEVTYVAIASALLKMECKEDAESVKEREGERLEFRRYSFQPQEGSLAG